MEVNGQLITIQSQKQLTVSCIKRNFGSRNIICVSSKAPKSVALCENVFLAAVKLRCVTYHEVKGKSVPVLN